MKFDFPKQYEKYFYVEWWVWISKFIRGEEKGWEWQIDAKCSAKEYGWAIGKSVLKNSGISNPQSPPGRKGFRRLSSASLRGYFIFKYVLTLVRVYDFNDRHSTQQKEHYLRYFRHLWKEWYVLQYHIKYEVLDNLGWLSKIFFLVEKNYIVNVFIVWILVKKWSSDAHEVALYFGYCLLMS